MIQTVHSSVRNVKQLMNQGVGRRALVDSNDRRDRSTRPSGGMAGSRVKGPTAVLTATRD
jgi:hypothetical protein